MGKADKKLVEVIYRWRPCEQYAQLKMGPSGELDGYVRTFIGRVEVFSFNGDDRNRAFTTFTLDYWDARWQLRLGRAYHRRWLTRLANAFAAEVWKQCCGGLRPCPS